MSCCDGSGKIKIERYATVPQIKDCHGCDKCVCPKCKGRGWNWCTCAVCRGLIPQEDRPSAEDRKMPCDTCHGTGKPTKEGE